MDLVTAVITTHNREYNIVERAVKSVLAQTYENIEIIVVDDSQNDYVQRAYIKQKLEEVSVIEKTDIKVIQHDTCSGACAARNTGLAQSHGKYIGFLDDDDEWIADKIESMLPAFFDPEVAIVYSNYYIYDDDNDTILKRKKSDVSGMVYNELIMENFIGSASFPLLRKDAVAITGGFDTELLASQDYDLWLRLSKRNKVKYIDKYLNIYHKYSGDKITNNLQSKIQGMERIIAKNENYINTNRNVFWRKHMELIPFYVNVGQKRTAFLKWRDCVCRCPYLIISNIKWLIYILIK